MKEARIIEQFFKDHLSNAYEIEAWINDIKASSPNDYERLINRTETLINQVLTDGRTRGIIRTSQSEYVSIPGIYSISFSWSLSLMTETGNRDVENDLMKIVHDFTGKIIPLDYNGEMYNLCFVFNSPASFSNTTMSGRRYMALEFGGRALITQNSLLGNEYQFEIDGRPLNGVISLNSGFTTQGDNYSSFENSEQHATVRTVTRAFTIQLHGIRGDTIIENLISDSMGTSELMSGTITKQGGTPKPFIVAESRTAFSLGSFVIVDVKLMVV